jgi:hypothetical protein
MILITYTNNNSRKVFNYILIIYKNIGIDNIAVDVVTAAGNSSHLCAVKESCSVIEV